VKPTNLFTALSSYQPGSSATPFENYCTSGLAHLLSRGHFMLTALLAQAGGVSGDPLAAVEVQPRIADAGIADLVLTFEGGRRVVVEVQVETAAAEDQLAAFERAGERWGIDLGFVVLGLGGQSPPPWRAVHWLDVVEALDDDSDPISQQYRDFVLSDILGLGPVTLEEALASNRLFALGGAAVRRRFGDQAVYANAASKPASGRYRYTGTMFAANGSPEMTFWVGLVNETVPLGEHYHLMLASKHGELPEQRDQPRALGDWRWTGWTGLGRVVRQITPADFDRLMQRL
jgi:hypothetical protein